MTCSHWMRGNALTLTLTLAMGASLSSSISACGEDVELTGDGGGTGGDSGGGGGDGSVTGDGAPADGAGLCVGCTACSNGMDDDSDGLVDGMDPECTSAADNDEGSFATGIPGDNRDPMWQDCFFDGNSGAGDDGCMYRTGCLTGELPASDPDCAVTAMCIDFCGGRTPNGCDCFGCCEVTLGDGTTRLITLASDCSLADIDSCTTCVQSTACANDCGTCELCPGRTAADLPAECYDMPDGGTPMYTCEGGISCMSDADCSGGAFCSLGCCLSGPF